MNRLMARKLTGDYLATSFFGRFISMSDFNNRNFLIRWCFKLAWQI